MDTLWQQSSEWLELYGASQLLLVATLSAITIFRREMSCNHCYYQESDDEASSSKESSSVLSEDWDDGETEELLEGAGRYCSVACLAPVLEKLKETSEEALLLAATTTAQDPQVSAEELLEGAGGFCSGFPYTAALLHPKMGLNTNLLNQPAKPFVTNLPLDAQVHVFMFLHPKDLLNVACVNKKCRDLLDQDTSTTTLTNSNSGSSSQTIWKRLWQRDYEWLLQAWPVGQRALQRSLNHNNASTTMDNSSLLAQVHFTKDFYFYFSLAYTNYLLAGNNTHECCLVGVGGHIYDLTFFLSSHPGSPETVMAHAGKEATAFFDGMNHSFGARRLARSLCVVVDTAFLSREVCGTCPTNITTTNTTTSDNNHNHSSIPHAVEAPVTFNSQTVIRKKGTLQRIRDAFVQEQASYQILVENMKLPELLGDINLYYDPIVQKWKAWYTAHNLTTVFVDTLNEDVLY